MMADELSLKVESFTSCCLSTNESNFTFLYTGFPLDKKCQSSMNLPCAHDLYDKCSKMSSLLDNKKRSADTPFPRWKILKKKKCHGFNRKRGSTPVYV